MNKFNSVLKFDLNKLSLEENKIRKHNEMIHFYKLTRPENYINNNNNNNNECYFNNDNDFLNDNDNAHDDINTKPQNIVNNVNHYYIYVEKCKKEQDEKRDALEKLNMYLKTIQNKYKIQNKYYDDMNIKEELNEIYDDFYKLQNDTFEFVEQHNDQNKRNNNNNNNNLENYDFLPYLDDIDDDDDDNFLKYIDNDSDSDSDSDNSVVDKEYLKEQDNYQQINNDQKYVSVLLSDLKEIDQGITLSNKQFQKISDFAGKIKL